MSSWAACTPSLWPRKARLARPLGNWTTSVRAAPDPAHILSPEMVQKIEELAAPPLWERAVYGALIFTGVYALIMIAMVVTAWILAVFTRGGQVLMPVGADPSDIVHTGQVARSGSETLLARVYLLALTLGLLLFYVAIPFVVLGLLGGTAGLLYLILLTGRIPIKLFLVILIVGLNDGLGGLQESLCQGGHCWFWHPQNRERRAEAARAAGGGCPTGRH